MSDLPPRSRFGDYMQWPGRAVLDAGGERLGTVEMIFLDDATNLPEWVRVALDGDESRLAMVPLADAEVTPEGIRVAQARDRVASAPPVSDRDHIDQDEERALYDHYGLGYSESRSSSGLPASPGADGDRAGAEESPAPAPAAGPRLRRLGPEGAAPEPSGDAAPAPAPSGDAAPAPAPSGDAAPEAAPTPPPAPTEPTPTTPPAPTEAAVRRLATPDPKLVAGAGIALALAFIGGLFAVRRRER